MQTVAAACKCGDAPHPLPGERRGAGQGHPAGQPLARLHLRRRGPRGAVLARRGRGGRRGALLRHGGGARPAPARRGQGCPTSSPWAARAPSARWASSTAWSSSPGSAPRWASAPRTCSTRAARAARWRALPPGVRCLDGTSTSPPSPSAPRTRATKAGRPTSPTPRWRFSAQAKRPPSRPGDLHVDRDYYAPGYEIPNKAGNDAIRRLARTEGVLTDPVYSGKGFAGLIDHIERGVVPQGSSVVFWHTGGATAIFSEPQIIGDLAQA